jgi:NitT/TauT family transport system substrate-binding protein
LPVVHVGGSADMDASPIVYGIAAGIFRRYGIEVAFQKAASGSAVAAAVAGGALDIGKSSVVPLISGHAHNVPFTIVAPSIAHRTGLADSALMVGVNSPVRAARDLDGKAVSVAGLRDMQWLATHAWLDANGGDSSSVQFLEIPGSSVGAALEQGRISAGTLSEPYITQAIKAGKARIFAKMVDAFGNAMTTAFFTINDFALKNRDLVGRFAHAVIEASA